MKFVFRSNRINQVFLETIIANIKITNSCLETISWTTFAHFVVQALRSVLVIETHETEALVQVNYLASLSVRHFVARGSCLESIGILAADFEHFGDFDITIAVRRVQVVPFAPFGISVAQKIFKYFKLISKIDERLLFF